MATNTSQISPGVYTLSELKCNWNPLTPGNVPIGALISAGKSGKVAKSIPSKAVLLVNC